MADDHKLYACRFQRPIHVGREGPFLDGVRVRVDGSMAVSINTWRLGKPTAATFSLRVLQSLRLRMASFPTSVSKAL